MLEARVSEFLSQHILHDSGGLPSSMRCTWLRNENFHLYVFVKARILMGAPQECHLASLVMSYLIYTTIDTQTSIK